MTDTIARSELALVKLQQSINMFADVYHAAIEVVAHDSMLFLLFIEKLQLLHEILSDLTAKNIRY